MSESEKRKENRNIIQKIAEEPAQKRKELLSATEKSVVLGLVYAAIICGLTMLLDVIRIPDSETVLWVILGGFFIALVGLSVFMEHLLFPKLKLRRTVFYLTAQLAVLVVIIVMIIIGIKTSGEEYYASRELSYAMAFSFSELALFIYHLIRTIILAICRSKAEGKKTSRKKKR